MLSQKKCELMPFEKVEDLLAGKGLRPTLHRIQIGSYLLSADHPSTESTLQWAKSHLGKVSRATVYNVINDFLEIGLLRELSSSQFSGTLFDNNLEPHFHFYDTETGEVHDIDVKNIKLSAHLDQSILIDDVEVFISGRIQR